MVKHARARSPKIFLKVILTISLNLFGMEI